MDNFDAHINHEVIRKLVNNHVKVVTLPPHSSHLLQALDMGIMLPFKKHMDNALAKYKDLEGGGNITEKDLIISLFKYYECHGKSAIGRPYNCFSKALRSHNIMSAFQDVGIWPLDYNKVKGLAYRQDTSSSPSSSLHSKSSGINVASNDPHASMSQIEAPSRAAALAEAEGILANSTGTSQAPPTRKAHIEEAARRYLMYTRMADHAKRDMEALSGMDAWQPAVEDILRPDPLAVGRKGRDEAKYAQIFTCEEAVLLKESKDKLGRDGPDVRVLLSGAVTTLKAKAKRFKSNMEAVQKKQVKPTWSEERSRSSSRERKILPTRDSPALYVLP
jgi:hypothetical protein